MRDEAVVAILRNTICARGRICIGRPSCSASVKDSRLFGIFAFIRVLLFIVILCIAKDRINPISCPCPTLFGKVDRTYRSAPQLIVDG